MLVENEHTLEDEIEPQCKKKRDIGAYRRRMQESVGVHINNTFLQYFVRNHAQDAAFATIYFTSIASNTFRVSLKETLLLILFTPASLLQKTI